MLVCQRYLARLAAFLTSSLMTCGTALIADRVF